MDEFISLIQFRTAIPFGYLLFSIAWLVLTVSGIITILVLAWKKKYRSPKLYLMLSLVALNFGYAYVNIYYGSDLDLNPLFSESELIGEWGDGKSKMLLLENGKAKLFLSPKHRKRLEIDNGSGYWYKENNFNLIIGSNERDRESKNALFRVIKYGKNYRIIIEDYEDLDQWDGGLGFKQSQ